MAGPLGHILRRLLSRANRSASENMPLGLLEMSITHIVSFCRLLGGRFAVPGIPLPYRGLGAAQAARDSAPDTSIVT